MTPIIATFIFVISCLAGMQYRRVWKREGPRFQLWVYGVISGVGLLSLGLIPLTQ